MNHNLSRLYLVLKTLFRSIPCGCCIVVLLTFGGQAQAQTGKDDDWKICTVCGIPARLALNSSPGNSFVPKRKIYLLIEPSDFTAENLTRAFQRLSDEYPDPIFLRITALSNREFLKQLISADQRAVIIDFADSPTARNLEQEYYSYLYPPRKGYFQSYYIRTAVNEESFQYTPDPMDEKTVQVILQKATK